MPDDDDKINSNIAYLVPVPVAEVPKDEEVPAEEVSEDIPKDDEVPAAEVSLPPPVAELVEVLIDGVRELGEDLSEEDDDDAKTIAVAHIAWLRIQHRTHQLWNDWVKIGKALEIGRNEAFFRSRAAAPKGKKYSREFSAWLKSNGFEDIHETARAFLLKIMDEFDAVEAWRDTLDADERHKWNHPSTVWQHFNAWKRREGKRPPVRSSMKAALENTIRERDEANAKVERLSREREDQGPYMTRADEPADIARVVFDWMPERKRAAFVREFNKLVKNPPRPSPLPKPPPEIPPRRHRATINDAVDALHDWAAARDAAKQDAPTIEPVDQDDEPEE